MPIGEKIRSSRRLGGALRCQRQLFIFAVVASLVLLLCLIIRYSHAGLGDQLLDGNNDAKYDSYGFFTDISDKNWELMKANARSEPLFLNISHPEHGSQNGAIWMMENFDPIFNCLHAKRIGGRGDGGKWVCDPHRLRGKKDCLVYSVGSRGEYKFEDGLIDFLGDKRQCEIHVFDPDPKFDREINKDKNIVYHSFGLKSSYRASRTWGGLEFRTIFEVLHLLGHENRRIDIFKVDCEGCEWTDYKDWLDKRVDVRQLLLETHMTVRQENTTTSELFEAFIDHGFIPFAKEANTHPAAKPPGHLFEYGFVRLRASFLDRKKKA